MLIGTPLIRSQRNWALPRLMKLMLVSGYEFKYIIKVRVFNSNLNLEVPIDVPVEETSRFAANVSRIWTMRSIGYRKGMYPHLSDNSFKES